MIRCPACSRENLPGSLFCARCGVHLATGKRLSTDDVPEEELPAEKRSPFEARAPTRPKGRPLEADLVLICEDGLEIVLPQATTLNLGRGQVPDGTTPMLDLTLFGAYKGGVSRFHACIHRQPTGFYIEDLLSTNGTHINEQRIPPYVPQGLRDGDKIQLGRLVLNFQIRSEFYPTPSPYIAGAPIKREKMFFGRDDIFEAVRAHLVGQHQDNVVVIYGQRRTGKTSVLYQMGRRLNTEGERYVAVLVDLQGLALDGMDNFLWELARTIRRALRRDYHLDLPTLDRTTFLADARSVFRDSVLPSFGKAIGERRLLLMIDEAVRFEEMVAAGRLEKDVFDYLRSLMQHERGLSFIFALGSKLEQMRHEYALMFNTALHLQVSFLDPAAARALVTQPVTDLYTFEEDAVERLLALTSCHPYFTQLLCHALFTRWEKEHWKRVTSTHVDAVLDEATSLSIANLQFIWNEADRAEKLVLAALAETQSNEVNAATLHRRFNETNIQMSQNELVRALNELTRREVIDSPAFPHFCVNLVRRWLTQEKPLAWVYEELEWTSTKLARQTSVQININVASVEKLQTLPGVGPITAAEIVDHRQKHGAFETADDLIYVKGIGKTTLEKLQPLITA
jgi:comEA protein